MRDHRIRYTKKVTKTIRATQIISADNADHARRILANSPLSGVGKVINTEIEITEFEVIGESKLGGLGR